MSGLTLIIFDEQQLEWTVDAIPQKGDWVTFAEQDLTQHTIRVVLALKEMYIRQVPIPDNIPVQKAAKSVEFLLEEELLEDLENLHIQVIGVGKQYVDVLIVPKQSWATWLTRLSSWKIEGVYALVQGIPPDHVCVIRDTAYVRTPLICFAGPVESVMALLEAKHINVESYSGYEVAPSVVGLPHRTHVASLATFLEPELEHRAPIAQWGGAQKQPLSSKKRMLHAGIFLSIAVCLLFSYKLFEYTKLKSKNQEIVAQVAELYYEIFPNAQAVVAPRLRMEQMMSNQVSIRQDNFFKLMHPLSQAMTDLPLEITEIQYRQDSLVIQIKAAQYDPIRALVTKLNASVHVEERDTRTTPEGLASTLVIKEGGA